MSAVVAPGDLCLVFSSPFRCGMSHRRRLPGQWRSSHYRAPPGPSRLRIVVVDHRHEVSDVFAFARWRGLVLMKFNLSVFFFYGGWFLGFKEFSAISCLQINFPVFSPRSFVFSSLTRSCVIHLACSPRLEPGFRFDSFSDQV